jgi:hypothetical protein
LAVIVTIKLHIGSGGKRGAVQPRHQSLDISGLSTAGAEMDM